MDIVEYNVILTIISAFFVLIILFVWLRMIGNQINQLTSTLAETMELICHMNTLLSAASVNDKK